MGRPSETSCRASNTGNTKASTTELNCRTNRPDKRSGRCEGSSHRGKPNSSYRLTRTSATCFEFAIVIRLLPTIAWLVVRRVKRGRRQPAPLMLPKNTYPAL